MDYTKYLQYIKNTGRNPLPSAMFDEDWEPIGRILRADMVKAGLITDGPDGVRLIDAARGK